MILTSDQEVLQDSTLIIEWFEQRFTEKSDIPCEPRLQYLMWLLEDFADEYMPRIHMHMLWDNQQNKRTVSHRLGRAYCYAKEGIAVQDIATMFASRQPNVDKHLGLSDEVRANMDKQIIDLLNILEEHFLHHQFLLVFKPSVTDFTLCGSLQIHLYNNPSSNETMGVYGQKSRSQGHGFGLTSHPKYSTDSNNQKGPVVMKALVLCKYPCRPVYPAKYRSF